MCCMYTSNAELRTLVVRQHQQYRSHFQVNKNSSELCPFNNKQIEANRLSLLYDIHSDSCRLFRYEVSSCFKFCFQHTFLYFIYIECQEKVRWQLKVTLCHGSHTRLTLTVTLDEYSGTTTMSKLLKDAASFKATMQRQDFASWHSQPRNPSASDSSTPSAVLPTAGDVPSPPKKKRPKSSMLAFSSLVVWGPATDLFNRYRLFAARRYRHWKQCQYTTCLCSQSFESELLDAQQQLEMNKSIVDAKSYETSRSSNCNEYADWYRPGLAREIQVAWQNPAWSKNRPLFLQGGFLFLFNRFTVLRTLFRSTNMRSVTKLHC